MDNIDFDLAEATAPPPAISIPAEEPRVRKIELIDPRKDDVIRDREIAFQVLNAIDAAQTIYCVHGIPERCEEANPLYGKRPSVEKIIAIKILDGAVHYAITDYLRDRNSPLVDVWQISTIVVYSGIVTWNATIIF